jgi:hypothetical protein
MDAIGQALNDLRRVSVHNTVIFIVTAVNISRPKHTFAISKFRIKFPQMQNILIIK